MKLTLVKRKIHYATIVLVSSVGREQRGFNSGVILSEHNVLLQCMKKPNLTPKQQLSEQIKK